MYRCTDHSDPRSRREKRRRSERGARPERGEVFRDQFHPVQPEDLPDFNRTWWERIDYSFGSYEYEVDDTYQETGWCRCAGGRLANGLWPEWNNRTGEQRYS